MSEQEETPSEQPLTSSTGDCEKIRETGEDVPSQTSQHSDHDSGEKVNSGAGSVKDKDTPEQDASPSQQEDVMDEPADTGQPTQLQQKQQEEQKGEGLDQSLKTSPSHLGGSKDEDAASVTPDDDRASRQSETGSKVAESEGNGKSKETPSASPAREIATSDTSSTVTAATTLPLAEVPRSDGETVTNSESQAVSTTKLSLDLASANAPIAATADDLSTADESASPTSNLVMDISFASADTGTLSTNPTPLLPIQEEVDGTSAEEKGEQGGSTEEKLDEGNVLDKEEVLGHAEDNVDIGCDQQSVKGDKVADGGLDSGGKGESSKEDRSTPTPDAAVPTSGSKEEEQDAISTSNISSTSPQTHTPDAPGIASADKPMTDLATEEDPAASDKPQPKNASLASSKTPNSSEDKSSAVEGDAPVAQVMATANLKSEVVAKVVTELMSKYSASNLTASSKSSTQEAPSKFSPEATPSTLSAETTPSTLGFESAPSSSSPAGGIAQTSVGGSPGVTPTCQSSRESGAQSTAVSSSIVPPAVPLNQLTGNDSKLVSSQSVPISRINVSSAAEIFSKSVVSTSTTVKNESTKSSSSLSSTATSVNISALPSFSLSSSSTTPAVSLVAVSSAPGGKSSSDKPATRLGKVAPGALAMPALSATVASTVLTAATSIVATPTTSSRPTSTTSKKPILSAGLSPTLSSNLAALFPSQAEKFAVPGNYPPSSFTSPHASSSDGPNLAKVHHSAKQQHTVLVTPSKSGVATGKSVVVAPGLPTVKKTDGSGIPSNAVPIITAIPTATSKKGVVASLSGTPIVIDPSNIAVAGAAARLKVGRAKALHSGSAIQQVSFDRDLVSPERLPAGMQSLSFDFTQFVMPKVLDVLTVGPAVKLGKKALVGKSEDSSVDPIPVVRMVNSGVSGIGGDLKPVQPGQKSTSHPVARRIWMSSCRPLDPASLERIGTDSDGNVYWYDGGKNLFQSPSTSDPAYKPSESELQLSCKSMVQWTARLKELRSSGHEEDVALAQTIKDNYINRVRIATQRKTRDSSLFQKLQAVHNFPLSSSSTTPLVSAPHSTGQVKVIAPQSTIAGVDNTAKLLPSAFPQGSILVVPPGSYPTVLPVFAQTAVIMPQNGPPIANATPMSSAPAASSKSSTSLAPSSSSANIVSKLTSTSAEPLSSTTPPIISTTQTSATVQSSSAATLTTAALKVPPAVAGLPAASTATLQQQQQQQQQPTAAIAIDGRLIGLPGGPVAISGANNADVIKLVQDAMATATMLGGVRGGAMMTPMLQGQPSSLSLPGSLPAANSSKKDEEVKKTDGAAAIVGGTAATLMPKSAPQAVAIPAGGKVAFSPQSLPFGHMVLTSSGLIMPQIYAMKVEEPLPVGKVSFESTSIELTGQVPIKKIDTETMEVVKSTGDGSSGVRSGAATDGGKGKKGVAHGSSVVSVDGSKGGKEGRDAKDSRKKGEAKEGKDKVSGLSKEGKASGEDAKNRVDQLEEDKSQKTTVPVTSSGGFHGHSTADIRSAELLLSLTGGGAKAWPATSPRKGAGQKESPLGVSPSGGVGDTQTPSSGRKRKQKPIASAKPSPQSGPQASAENALKADVSFSVPKPKRPRKSKKAESAPVVGKESPAKQGAGKDGGSGAAKKSKQLTSQELLEIMNIPPPPPQPEAAVEVDNNATATAPAPGSDASLRMEQLKASRVGKPMKEFVIETDSDDSNSSSSSSDSSRANSDGSSSDSSSESSSSDEDNSSESKTKTPVKKPPASSNRGGRGRGRGVGGAPRRGKAASQSSSSDDSSSDEGNDGEREGGPAVGRKRKRGEGQRSRGGKRGGGGGRGRTVPQGGSLEHIVSIPTKLLKNKLKHLKKQKNGQANLEDPKKGVAADFATDLPVDLASLYAMKGGVDLGTLSELTKSVGVSEGDGSVSRSKRTCVRVRQEISKLQEILNDDLSDSKPGKVSGGRSKGRSSSGGGGVNARSSLGPKSAEVDDDALSGSGLLPSATKKKRSTYSQFTHKRRKRKKKQFEEEPLWQPASGQDSGKSLKTIYTFSTLWANEASDAVVSGKCDSIILFHQKQPKGPGFHRHPPDYVMEGIMDEEEEEQKEEKEKEKKEKEKEKEKAATKVAPSRPVRKGRSAAAAEEKTEEKLKEKEEKEKDKGKDSEETAEEEEEEKPRAGKRKSRRVGSSEVIQPSAAKKKRGASQKNQPAAPKDPSPQPFLRSSRRLRRMKNPSPSPPPPAAPSSTSESEKEEDEPEEEEEEEEPKTKTPSPLPAPVKSSSSGRITRASRRLASARLQRTSATNTSVDSDVATKSPLSKQQETSPEASKPQEKATGRLSKVSEEAKNKEKSDKDASQDGDESSDSDVYKSPVTRSPEKPPDRMAAQPVEQEDNYTICHGTPQTNQVVSRQSDMSSPREWQQSGQLGLQQQSQQRQQQQAAAPHQPQQQQQQQHRHEQQATAPYQQQQQSQLAQQPKPQESFGSPGSDQQILSPDAVPPGRGVAPFGSMGGGGGAIDDDRRGISSAGHTSSEYPHPHMPLPPQYAQATSEQFYGKDWGAGSQAAAAAYSSIRGMPGSFPGMYGHPMHGMPYGAGPAGAPHTLAAAAGRPNYQAYPMPYSWGHSAAIHHHHQLQQQQGGGVGGAAMSSGQHRPGADRMQGRLPVGGGVAEFPSGISPHGHGTLPTMHEKRKSYSDSPSTSPGPVAAGNSSTVQARPPPGTDRASSMTSATSMRVGGAPSSSGNREANSQQQQHLSQQQHGLPPPPGMAAAHSQGPHDGHLPPSHVTPPPPHAAAFPYPFEPSPSSLHMWQQSQIHAAHRPISGMHPAAAAHLPHGMGTHAGIWYGHPAGAQIHPHLLQGGQEIHPAAGHGGGKKATGAKGKRDGTGDKSSNRNNSNNNNDVMTVPGFFPTSHEQQSYENLNSQTIGRDGNSQVASGYTSQMLTQQQQHQQIMPPNI